jgi:hypothetical protein
VRYRAVLTVDTMGIRSDIGQRVELVSMDPRFEEISIGLYRSETDEGPLAVVHSYSGRPGVDGRLAFVARAMATLGGLEPAGDRSLRFSCRDWHQAAVKRLFLEACKHDPDVPLEPRPLATKDTRSEQAISVESLGGGRYRVDADGGDPETPSRAAAIAAALAKLAELEPSEDDPAEVAFRCRHAHDELLGVLLVRALNLRQALREEELSASRGVLVAPSAQAAP